MSHDDQFTATGPPLSGSGKPRSAFSSRATGMVYGANVQGDRAGVYGESVRADTGRDSDIEGVGVVGVGDNFGVYARSFPSPGRRGIAGLFAQHNRGGVGAIGAVMRGGIGVVGTSVGSLGNPLATFADGTGPGDGSGTGVLGTSGSGSGVRGTSGSSSGVLGTSGSGSGVSGVSDDGDAVAGRSRSGRGGRFESGRTRGGSIVAQIGLVPQRLPTTRRVRPAPTIWDLAIHDVLPAEGTGGDLLVTEGDDGACTLWFCIRSSNDETRAVWREVLLGDPATARPLDAEIAFVDWLRVGDDRAIGSLHGRDVTLVGPMGTGSAVDGTFRGFDSDLFSPRIPGSDCIEIVGRVGHTYTLTFDEPVSDLVVHLASLGSVIEFPAGVVVTKVSGDGGLSVSGSTVTGTVVPPSSDSNGTVRLSGPLQTVTFSVVTNVADPEIPDGILFQVGVPRT
jgi:hypothetical protein